MRLSTRTALCFLRKHLHDLTMEQVADLMRACQAETWLRLEKPLIKAFDELGKSIQKWMDSEQGKVVTALAASLAEQREKNPGGN